MHEPVYPPPPLPPLGVVTPPPALPVGLEGGAEEPEIIEEGRFYKIDSCRATFREYLFETKNPIVLTIAAVLKILRIRLSGSSDDPNVEMLAPFETGEGSFPPEVRAQMEPLVTGLAALGFHAPVCHQIIDPVQSTRHCLVSFCHPSGQAVARVHLRIWRRPHPPKVYLFTEFITAFTDDTFVWSLSSKPDLLAPPSCRVNRRIGMAPAELWKSHQEELAKEAGRGVILTAGDREELLDIVERHHGIVRDFHVGRGVFVPFGEAELRQAAAIRQNQQALAGSGAEHAEVFAEIDKLQNKRAGWGGALLLLVVSVFVFLGAGRSMWSWETLLILIGVLFFHEMGHYIAMRAFGYRNLRMFFIPFLGAAVSGRNYNVAGWKKVIVSLMGPVPGIIVGAVVGMAGIVLERPMLVTVGTMSLILNGFNLLPVLPLDGGWVMHVLVFSRHHILDVTFRLGAAVALLGIGFASGDRVLMIIGGAMLLSLPIAYKLARLTTDLRRAGLQGISPDDQTIPAPVAQTIIGRVKEAFPKGMNSKSIAQHTLHVFETLNARPPSVAASIGLGIVHWGSFFAVVVFAVLLVVQQQGGLGAFGRFGVNNVREPKYALDAGAIREHRAVGAVSPRDSASRVTVVATFPVGSDAVETFEQMKSNPAAGSLLLFGHSVLVTIPGGDDARRQQLHRRLQSKTDDTFVEHDELRATMELACSAPDEAAATRLQQQLSQYFFTAPLHLIPPWSPDDARTPEERARHERARLTYQRLTTSGTRAMLDPALRQLSAKRTQARREGDDQAVVDLEEEYEKMLRVVRRREVENLRQAAATDDTPDGELIDRYSKIEGNLWDEGWNRQAVAELGPLMGQVAMEGAKPAPGAARYGAGGVASAQGSRLHFFALYFTSTPEGAPALVRWLREQGCSGLKYQFHSAEGEMDDLELEGLGGE